jgi:hypothetical protein
VGAVIPAAAASATPPAAPASFVTPMTHAEPAPPPARPARRAPAVQVEIGRVEVVSGSPAPKPRAGRPRAQPITSLDDYARRWGGRRP